jgi:hypothetical protein
LTTTSIERQARRIVGASHFSWETTVAEWETAVFRGQLQKLELHRGASAGAISEAAVENSAGLELGKSGFTFERLFCGGSPSLVFSRSFRSAAVKKERKK